MKNFKGFTLAEVLITLGIIGVVAAMTLPSLISNYQKIVLETQYKKGISVFANAMQMAMARNNTPGDLGSTPISQCYSVTDTMQKADCFKEESKKLFSVTLDAYNQAFAESLIMLEYSEPSLSSIFFPPVYASAAFEPYPWQLGLNWVFMTPDGIVYGFNQYVQDYERTMLGFYVLMDVNGAKKPNKVGEDLFKLAINNSGKVTDMTCLLRTGGNRCTSEDMKNAFGTDMIY